MSKLNERNVINSIELVKSGEHQGKFKINVSTSILQSKDLIADIGNIQSIFSVGNDDIGEENIENNVVNISNFIDLTSGLKIDVDQFLLPADSWKDIQIIDWVLSIKTNG